MNTPEFVPCPEAQAIGHRLISNEPDHLHLQGLRIGYVRSMKEMKSQGRVVLGKARLVKKYEKDVFASDLDFVVILNALHWDFQNEGTREAIIDHELSHCGYDADEDRCRIRPHDLQEFASVVRRRGLYLDDVKQMANAMQPHLEGLTTDWSIDALREL